MAIHNQKLAALSEEEGNFESNYERRRLEKLKKKTIDYDIDENVIYWLDVIDEPNFPGTVIMPVILTSNLLDKREINYRCSLLTNRLNEYKRRLNEDEKDTIILLNDSDKVFVVNPDEEKALNELRHNLISQVNNSSLFQGRFQSLSPVEIRTEEVIKHFKSKGHKIVQFDEVYTEIKKKPGENISEETVQQALSNLSSIGEIVYFGKDVTECSEPFLLKLFIILDPKWISDAIAPVLDEEEIRELRQHSHGNTLLSLGDYFNKLFLTEDETVQIWEHVNYLYEDDNLSDTIATDDIIDFLKQVCEHCGIFLPIMIPDAIEPMEGSISYLLPRVTAEPPSSSPWSFTAGDYKTIICHSWLIKEVLPVTFMDLVSAAVVSDLIALFGQNKQPDRRSSESHVSTFVEQIMCYKTAIYVKVVELMRGDKNFKKINEIYICLVHSNFRNCVNSDNMQNTDRKLMVCGKGFEGRYGETIWNLGYDSILHTVDNVVKGNTKGNFIREIACPYCLLHMTTPREVPCWRKDTVDSQPGEETLRCNNQSHVHMVAPQLLRGDLMVREDDDCSIVSSATGVTAWSAISHATAMTALTYDTLERPNPRTIPEMLPSVVLVSLWDTKSQRICSTGSGFIADKNRGLIVTAGHIFYKLRNNEAYEEKFFGIKNSTAIVGIYDDKKGQAIFRYTANVLVHDLAKADCCVLRLHEKFEHPIDSDGFHVPYPQAMTFNLNPREEPLSSLPLTDTVDLETKVRVMGYNQEGEGLYNDDDKIDRSPCFENGQVMKKMSGSDMVSRNRNGPKIHIPESEVVIESKTKFGHSGGPCVNSIGEVIGIVSRSDPIDAKTCYLAPSKIIASLLKKAKQKVDEKEKKNKVRFNTGMFNNT